MGELEKYTIDEKIRNILKFIKKQVEVDGHYKLGADYHTQYMKLMYQKYAFLPKKSYGFFDHNNQEIESFVSVDDKWSIVYDWGGYPLRWCFYDNQWLLNGTDENGEMYMGYYGGMSTDMSAEQRDKDIAEIMSGSDKWQSF